MDVLIVENDAIVTKMWSKGLSKSHTVRSAESVLAAKKEILHKLPDIVILDLRLNGPSNSGLDIFELIRQDLNNTVPIIFITGLAYNVDLFKKAQCFVEADESKGIKTSLIAKPIRMAELLDVVASAGGTPTTAMAVGA